MPRLRGTGMTLWHSLVADLGRAVFFSSAARTNIRVCDRRVTAFAGASPLLQRDDCIAAYYFHKPAMRDGESNER